jgi:hypothetical protein
MAILIESKRKKIATIQKTTPGSPIIDLTSKGDHPWVKFSPFYPHGDIPVAFSEDLMAQSVEGIWQGLKVFENADVDVSKFQITDMKNIKRTTRKYGKVLGHRKGVKGDSLLSYLDARKQIYLPSYRWVLENKLQDEISALKDIISGNKDTVFLDYETNADINILSKPLSHAYLVRAYLLNDWPAQR